MGKKIKINLLSVDSIDQAIAELETYKKDFQRKVDILRDRLAEEITDLAQAGFSGAMIDDVLPGYGSSRNAEVTVYHYGTGDITVVVADGKDAIWVEFGAGVYHNGSAGSSPHPQGAKLGYTIGGYGKGKGKSKVWGYYDASGKNGLVLTHGTPATMPLYNAMKTVSNKAVSIAREVFKS
jgi:hypothetical protein